MPNFGHLYSTLWHYQRYPPYELVAFGALISMMDASQITFTFSGESNMKKVKVKNWHALNLGNLSFELGHYQSYPPYDSTAFGAVISVMDASETTFTFYCGLHSKLMK